MTMLVINLRHEPRGFVLAELADQRCHLRRHLLEGRQRRGEALREQNRRGRARQGNVRQREAIAGKIVPAVFQPPVDIIDGRSSMMSR